MDEYKVVQQDALEGQKLAVLSELLNNCDANEVADPP